MVSPDKKLTDFVEGIKRYFSTSKTLRHSDPASIPLPGRETQLIGPAFREPVRYEVRELADVLPSHEPERNFQRTENYPKLAQERPYDKDLGEKEKVIANATNFEPAFLLSDDPGATNGPPIITRDGIVLGGNSRTMSLKLVYAKNTEKATAYREALKAKAAQYGIDPAAIDGMQRPILVRALDESPTPEVMALKSRQYNQNLTQAMQAEAEGISRARFLKPATLDALATGIKEKGTIREFLASAESAEFAKNLLDDGVIQQSEYSSLITKTGRLNEKGKALALTVLRGFILPDYDLIQALPKKVIDKLDAVIPAFAQSKLRGEGWDLSRALDAAMRFVAKAESEKTTVEQQFRQHSLTGADAMRDDPQVQALAMTIANADAREIRSRLDYYMSMASMKGAGQNSLIPELGINPETAFQKAFWEKLAILDGEILRNFNPKENQRDAALQWVWDNSGKSKTKTIEGALNILEKKSNKKNISDAEKERLVTYYMELARLSGKFSIEQPKLGKLWEDPDAPRPEPTAKPEEAGQPGKDATGKDTEGKQATPDADKPGIQDQVDMTNPDALQLPELREEPVIRAQIEFNDQTTRAAVTFFKSANLASAPHELFHIFRRELEATANSAKGSARAKEQWRRLQEQMGGRDGEAWTVAMEEEFANMGLRYLAEGKAPMPGLQGVFEAFRRWLMDIYKSYDRIGGEISPEMRQIFDAMFYVPYDVADRQFRYALGEQYLRRPEEEFADPASVGERLAPEDEKAIQAEKSGDEKLATELAEDARAQGEEAAARLERDDPELARKELAEERQELAEIEEAEKLLESQSELRDHTVECLVNGG